MGLSLTPQDQKFVRKRWAFIHRLRLTPRSVDSDVSCFLTLLTNAGGVYGIRIRGLLRDRQTHLANYANTPLNSQVYLHINLVHASQDQHVKRRPNVRIQTKETWQNWWRWSESSRRPIQCHWIALPSELHPREWYLHWWRMRASNPPVWN